MVETIKKEVSVHVVWRIVWAATRAKRLRGLLGVKPHADILLLAPCRDVHTFGMKHPLDIAFLDERGYVLSAFREVGARRRLRHRSASVVLERFSAPCEQWFEPGEQVLLCRSGKQATRVSADNFDQPKKLRHTPNTLI